MFFPDLRILKHCTDLLQIFHRAQPVLSRKTRTLWQVSDRAKIYQHLHDITLAQTREASQLAQQGSQESTIEKTIRDVRQRWMYELKSFWRIKPPLKMLVTSVINCNEITQNGGILGLMICGIKQSNASF